MTLRQLARAGALWLAPVCVALDVYVAAAAWSRGDFGWIPFWGPVTMAALLVIIWRDAFRDVRRERAKRRAQEAELRTHPCDH